MPVNVLAFGKLSEIISENISFTDIRDTDDLQALLYQQFPLLHQYKFAVAVDQVIIQSNTQLREDAVVALLPPFSGG